MCASSTDIVSIFLLDAHERCVCIGALARFQMEFAIAVRKSPNPQLNYHLADVRTPATAAAGSCMY